MTDKQPTATDVDLEGIEAYVNAATGGPWDHDACGLGPRYHDIMVKGAGDLEFIAEYAYPHDAEFIARIRADAPKLTEALRSAVEWRDRWRVLAEVAQQQVESVNELHAIELRSARAERDALQERVGKMLRSDTPWPLESVLTKLIDAADHLMHGHACDRHGHETVVYAVDSARKILAELRIARVTP